MGSGYVLTGYGLTVGTLGLYALRVLRRGRALSRSLPVGPASAGPVRTTGPGGGRLLRDESPNRAPAGGA